MFAVKLKEVLSVYLRSAVDPAVYVYAGGTENFSSSSAQDLGTSAKPLWIQPPPVE